MPSITICFNFTLGVDTSYFLSWDPLDSDAGDSVGWVATYESKTNDFTKGVIPICLEATKEATEVLQQKVITLMGPQLTKYD